MLADFLRANQKAEVADLLGELLSLPPVTVVHLLDLILCLNEQLDVAVALLLRENFQDGW